MTEIDLETESAPRFQLQSPTKLAAAGMGGNAEGLQLVAKQREMKVNAGVLKTFDEIIVNAVDRQVGDEMHANRGAQRCRP